ncbi:MAG: hypothetical protein GC149_04185 [Gammaproteobacteria bacterium]|nr:hypothetical protein [Gammaproteobacteria bacterium]
MLTIRRFFTRDGFSQLLQSLDSRSPVASAILAGVAAGLGYFILALIPLLGIIGLLKVALGISTAGSLGAWIHLFIWTLISAACLVLTFAHLRVKFSPPSGLGLKDDKAPRLYEMLAELGETYKLPRIHRLVIHDKFGLELIPVPRFGLPFLTTNVLYIGLPILQSLSPNEFRGALARVLGQYSAVQNRKTHWVYRCYQFFQQSQHAYHKQHSALFQPLRTFFNAYTPFLKYLSASVLRRDELEADIYMLEIMNDTDAADVILRYEVSQAFLKNKYWPKIYAMLRKHPENPEYLPHTNMTKVLRNALTENEFAQTLKDLMNQDPNWLNIKPDVHTRLGNIGQTKLNMPPPVMETAAQRYLSDAFGAVIKLLDKQWLAKYSKSPKGKKTPAEKSTTATDAEPAHVRTDAAPTVRQAQMKTPAPMTQDEHLNVITSEEGSTVTVAERKRLTELKQKADFADLNDNEAWEYARLTEKLEDKSLAISLYQQVLKQNPNHAKTLFAVGRILLTRNDASGVKALERAMELDKGCIAQGCWMLAKFYKANGDEARSKAYLERAANVSVAA